MRRARLAAVAALLFAAPLLVAPSHAAVSLPPVPSVPSLPGLNPGATATDPVTTGTWFLLGGSTPAPPTVPADGLWIASLPVGPIAMSAMQFQMKPDEAQPIVTLTFANLTTEPSTPLGTGQYPIVACPITSKWTPTGANPGAWAARPVYDCSKGLISGTVSPDKKTLTFDLTTVTTEGQDVDLAFIPGNVTNSLIGILPIAPPTLPTVPNLLPDGLSVPNLLAPEQPSTFDASFQPLVTKDVNTVSFAPTSTSASAPAGQSVSPDLPSSSSFSSPSSSPLPLLASPAPALSAPATQSAAPAASVPLPVSTTVAAAAPASSSTGRRILAGLFVGALALWVLSVLTRRRNVGMPASAPAAEALTIGAWMRGTSSARQGQPPPIS